MLDFLYYAIAWVMKLWHSVWSTFLDPASGFAWVLSIVFLVFTVRIILFPLFVKMIRSQRAMQELQPEIAKLKAEFGSDRQGLSEAMMKLQRERKVNPVAGCLPMVLQAPVFIALLHVLRRLRPDGQGLYSWDDAMTHQAAVAQVFGAPISSNFLMKGQKLNLLVDATGTTDLKIKVVTGVLIVVMCVTQFISTKQIMKRSGPVAAGQMAMVQKLMLYGAPLGLLVSGTIFPLGVLVYWFFNNLWTIGQQFWVLKKMPPPNAGGKDAAVAPVVTDPTKLAPRPGAKPNRKPASVAVIDGESTSVDEPPTDSPAKKTTVAGTNGTPAKNTGGKSGGSKGSPTGANNSAGTKAGAGAPRTATRGNNTATPTEAGATTAKSAAKPKPGNRPNPQRRKKR